MTLEEAIAKITEEFKECYPKNKLMINCGYPYFEIWYENINGGEVFISGTPYDDTHKVNGYIGDEMLKNIRFKKECNLTEVLDYDYLNNMVLTSVKNYIGIKRNFN